MRLVAAAKRALPQSLVKEIRRYRYALQIRRDRFRSPEAEFDLLSHWVKPGDNVIDIGANVGHYTLQLSRLVGDKGRVFAFEPIPATFTMLASNIAARGASNVTLLNLAVTSSHTDLSFEIPHGNPYLARITTDGAIRVRGAPIDAIIGQECPISFMKVDAEGHDEIVLYSASALINKHRPLIMTELGNDSCDRICTEFADYSIRRITGSHNSFLVPSARLSEVDTAIASNTLQLSESHHVTK